MDIARPDQRARRRRKTVFVAVLVAAAAVGISAGLRAIRPADPVLELAGLWTGKVQRGPFVRDLRAPGTLEPVRLWWIATEVEGRVREVPLRPGAPVEPDTVLVVLENPRLEREALDAELELATLEAEQELLRVQLSNRKLDLEAAVASARSKLREEELRGEVNEELTKNGLVPEIELRVSKVKLEEFGKLLTIEEARLASCDDSATAELAAKLARVDQARALSGLKHAEVQSLSVRAGIAGVLESLAVEVGQRVTASASLARVSDPSELKAVLRVTQSQAPDVQLGQSVSVDARSGVVSGTVARISPAVESGSVEVDVTLTGALPRGARPRLSVDGTVLLERIEDALYVPRPASAEVGAQLGLFKLVEARSAAVRTQVQLGRLSVNSAEVVGGLVEGDEVVLGDMQAWSERPRLRLR
jgi:HlyD family secretion protein